jgi:hypothetical protein
MIETISNTAEKTRLELKIFDLEQDISYLEPLRSEKTEISQNLLL